jgi:hypothetical protein
MAITIILKKRKRKESDDTVHQQCSFSIVNCPCSNRTQSGGPGGGNRKRRKGEEFLTEDELLGGR